MFCKKKSFWQRFTCISGLSDISYLFWFDDFFFQEESSGRKESSPTGKSSSGSESPKPGRRRFGSTADEIDVTKLNGMAENAINNATSSGGTTATNAELEAMKQEILREMRKEMAKMKQDIIEGMSGIRNFSQLVDFELT